MLARMNVQPMSFWREFNDIDNWLTAANGRLDASSRWVPSVDVIEQENQYVLRADLPGVDRKDIEIVYEDGTLTLKGQRSEKVVSDNDKFKRIERSYGSFQRAFHMPENINADEIKAKSEHGVLEVTVPKQEKAQKKIEVL